MVSYPVAKDTHGNVHFIDKEKSEERAEQIGSSGILVTHCNIEIMADFDDIEEFRSTDFSQMEDYCPDCKMVFDRKVD